MAGMVIALTLQCGDWTARLALPETIAETVRQAVGDALGQGVSAEVATSIALAELSDWLTCDLSEASVDFVSNVEFAARRTVGRRAG